MSGPVINSYKDLLVWQDAMTFVQFLRIAQGSLKEVETHLFLSLRVEIASARDPLIEKSERLGEMLRGLIRSLQDKVRPFPIRHSPFAIRVPHHDRSHRPQLYS